MKKLVLKKTLQVGGSTLMSRLIALAREMLFVRFFISKDISDAFFTAFSIPNSFRKIFAEGALSAAFIPSFVGLMKREGKENASRLMTLSFLFFESLVLVLCIFCIWRAELVLSWVVPGFSADRIMVVVPYFKILMPFIFFISSSALLAGALQAQNHFFIPAFAPVLWNGVMIAGLLLGIRYGLSTTFLCWVTLLGGIVFFLAHLCMYFYLYFSFPSVNKVALQEFRFMFVKFFVYFFSMSVLEINFLVDRAFCSYLPSGSISAYHYSSRFMGIPLGVFAVAFSTVLLPQFSRMVVSAVSRVPFYLLEAVKMVLWVTIPSTLVMCFFAHDVFVTIFMCDKFPYDQVNIAYQAFIVFMIGLFCFSYRKVLLNVYYSLHDRTVPTVAALVGTCSNIALNWFLLPVFHLNGVVLATVVATGLEVVLLLFFLRKRSVLSFGRLGSITVGYSNTLYAGRIAQFIARYLVQVLIVVTPIYGLYRVLHGQLGSISPELSRIFLRSLVLWVWVTPLVAFFFFLLYRTRKMFGVKLFFLGD